MTVEVSDFEVFQALAMDSQSSEEHKSGGKEKVKYMWCTLPFKPFSLQKNTV